MFDAHKYFEKICQTNKLLIEGKYHFCRVTGISYMEEVIQKFQREKAYFCIDDTEDGTIISNSGNGYFERRQYTVFILKKYSFNNMDEQHAALEECRRICRQIVKKLIFDRSVLANEMTYLHVDRIPFYEVPGYFISGCTGLYFMVTVDIPTELCYEPEDWE